MSVTMFIVETAAPVTAGAWFCIWRQRRAGSAATIRRWSKRNKRKHGTATAFDIYKSNRHTARRGKSVRPTLAGLPRAERRRLARTEFGQPIAKVGGHTVWTSWEDQAAIIGTPGSGKSWWIASRILDAPGAVICTSTKKDLYDLTAKIRAKRGGVYVYNPGGVGGLPDSLGYDPLNGCENRLTALDRAADMVRAGGSGSGLSNADFWRDQAARVLGALMYAAALGGHSFVDIKAWVAQPEANRPTIIEALHKGGPDAGEAIKEVVQFIETNPNTRTSTTATISPALMWVALPSARAAAAKGGVFDMAKFLDERATIYLIGDKSTHVGPLTTALCGQIAREARKLGALSPAGRLDPPLHLILDEATLSAPVPLPDWSADQRGLGISMIIGVQSRAQLEKVYDQTGMRAIMSNCPTRIILGGGGDRDELQYFSDLCGQRDERVHSHDAHGKKSGSSIRSVPVVSLAQLSALPPHQALVFHRGIPPMLARIPAFDKRWDVTGGPLLVRGARWAIQAGRSLLEREAVATQSRRRLAVGSDGVASIVTEARGVRS